MYSSASSSAAAGAASVGAAAAAAGVGAAGVGAAGGERRLKAAAAGVIPVEEGEGAGACDESRNEEQMKEKTVRELVKEIS